MGKLKEYYHDEINSGMHGEDNNYAVANMMQIQGATADWVQGRMTTANWVKTIMREVQDFENRHDPCQPN